MKLNAKQENTLRWAIAMRPDLFEKPSLTNVVRLFGWAIMMRIKLSLRRIA